MPPRGRAVGGLARVHPDRRDTSGGVNQRGFSFGFCEVAWRNTGMVVDMEDKRQGIGCDCLASAEYARAHTTLRPVLAMSSPCRGNAGTPAGGVKIVKYGRNVRKIGGVRTRRARDDIVTPSGDPAVAGMERRR